MATFDNLRTAISGYSGRALDRIHRVRVELQIKSARRELKDLYMQIGELIYLEQRQNRKPKGLTDLLSCVDRLRNRLKQLEQTLAELPSTAEVCAYDAETETLYEAETNTYVKLRKKSNDLHMIRTDEGIVMVRVCPECKFHNDAQAAICVQCHHMLYKKV